RAHHPFPTRRSSDLLWRKVVALRERMVLWAEKQELIFRDRRGRNAVRLIGKRDQRSVDSARAQRFDKTSRQILTQLQPQLRKLRSEEHTSELQSREN